MLDNVTVSDAPTSVNAIVATRTSDTLGELKEIRSPLAEKLEATTAPPIKTDAERKPNDAGSIKTLS